MSEIIQPFTQESGVSGAMIYESQWHGKIRPEHFDHALRANSSQTRALDGGRGETYLVQLDYADRPWVLRQNLRGGIYGRFVERSYLYSGQDKVRTFVEWRLLQQIENSQIPVVKSIAAIYWKHGISYRAALLTEYIPDSVTLSRKLINREKINWFNISSAVRIMHQKCIIHGDLNCHNILISTDDVVTLIDFDKSYLSDESPSSLENRITKNLQRFKRSIQKVSDFSEVELEKIWSQFEADYHSNVIQDAEVHPYTENREESVTTKVSTGAV